MDLLTIILVETVIIVGSAAYMITRSACFIHGIDKSS
ncbi:MAG: hypothetical protein Ct9H90mV1_0700 [Prasinovirus sp.]|jgi:hypothetical protein|nr:MAG: hypothetical protein Ct9H90mV1_0700 [Prasinovirus sp.]